MGNFDFEERTENDACEKHGPYQARIINMGRGERRMGCPQCSEESAAARREQDRLEQLRSRVEMALGESGIPILYRDCALTSEAPKAARDWLRAFIDRATTGPLVMVGDVGTGKTYTACAMALELINSGLYAKYISALVYCRKIRDTWGRNADPREDQILESYARAPFLVIDELGAGKAADEPIIQELICARYDANQMRRTIIVTNVAPNKFAEKIGERAADRIKDKAVLLTMTGDSLRRPAA